MNQSTPTQRQAPVVTDTDTGREEDGGGGDQYRYEIDRVNMHTFRPTRQTFIALRSARAFAVPSPARFTLVEK